MRRLPLALALVLALGGVGFWYAWSPPAANDLVSGDEGYYGTMARNVVASPRYLVSPSLWPLGAPGDKPPLYPAMLAVSLRVFGVGETAVRGPSFLLAAVTLLAVTFLLRRAAGPWAGVAGVALLVTLPWFADASRGASAEIPTTMFGVLALAVLAASPPSGRRACVAGVLLGLGFLCKLWLVAPFVLAAMALLGPGRDRAGQHARLLGCAAATGALHGLAVLAFEPTSRDHWLQIYFGRSLLERAGGAGYAGGWVKHPAYYWAILVHALALMFPLAVAGTEHAWRRFREPVPRAIAVWAAAVLLLSAFSVKTGIYAYVVLPAWGALAALGAWSFVERGRPSLIAIAAGLAVSSPWLIPDAAGQKLGLLLWAGVWVASLAAWFVVAARPQWRRAAAISLVALACAGGFVREAQRLPVRYNQTGLRVLASTVSSDLADVPPSRTCFVSPEAPAFAFYLFRTGTYWNTPFMPWNPERAARLRGNPDLRVFVVDTTDQLYGGSPDSATLAWLRDSTVEITGEFRARLGRDSHLRVFRR